jgi:hypothetical protein
MIAKFSLQVEKIIISQPLFDLRIIIHHLRSLKSNIQKLIKTDEKTQKTDEFH